MFLFLLLQPPRHPSPIPGQPQGPGLPGHPSPSASPCGSIHSTQQQQQPPTALGTGGAPHDMSKQGAPNRPALTPSPVQQGTILPGQPMLINPQQIMYAHQPNMPRGVSIFTTKLIQYLLGQSYNVGSVIFIVNCCYDVKDIVVCHDL